MARRHQRQIRCTFGAPAPIRPNSLWAGSWTGVSHVSDYPQRPLALAWPEEQWNSARVMATQHWIHALPVIVGTIYGHSPGPTWPKARRLTDMLFEVFTREVVFGASGVRILTGDFNADPGELPQQLYGDSKAGLTCRTWRRPDGTTPSFLLARMLPNVTRSGFLRKLRCWQVESGLTKSLWIT